MDALLKLFIDLEMIRSYIVPTGSMASTILGYHKRVACPTCGSDVRVNASWEADGRIITGCTCSQCWQQIRFDGGKKGPGTRGGDRLIEVNVGRAYQRFDLVALRYPRSQPREKVIYLERVLGLPGETLALYQGDLYRTDRLKFDDADVPAADLWMPQHMHIDDPRAQKLFGQGKFDIVRKAPLTMLALRQLVHDQNHSAKEAPPRWSADKDSAWRPDTKRGFQIKAEGGEVNWLRYRHLRPSGAQKARPSLVTDFLSYNSFTTGDIDRAPEENWVGDLMIELEVEVAAARGELWLELGRGAERIQARVHLESGEVALVRTGKAQRELARRPAGVKLTGKHRLRFADFDRRATLWIDDALPFGDGIAYERAPKLGPTSADLEPVRIAGVGASVRVDGLKIWRDVYWSRRPAMADHGERVDWSDPASWNALADVSAACAYVQPGHYFVLGDNPMASSDSRDWGLAPARNMRGHTLLRYWPPERIGWLR